MQYSCLVSQLGHLISAEVLQASEIHLNEQPTS